AAAASPAAPRAAPGALSDAVSGTTSCAEAGRAVSRATPVAVLGAASGAASTLGGSAIAWLVGFAQRADESLEILRLAEVAVDAGEADIAHRIQLLQRVHHQLADLLGRDVAFAGGLEL